jgi:hypothetical protein
MKLIPKTIEELVAFIEKNELDARIVSFDVSAIDDLSRFGITENPNVTINVTMHCEDKNKEQILEE